MEILQTNDFVSIILSAEVLFTVIFTISLFVAVHAPMGFMRQSNSLFTRLAQIEAELNVLLATIPGKLERMRDNLAPLQAEFKEIQAYFRRLQHMDRRWLAQQAKKSGKKIRTRTTRFNVSEWAWTASSEVQKISPDPMSATIWPASCSTYPSLNTRLSR